MTRSIIRAWQSQDQSSEHAFLISKFGTCISHFSSFFIVGLEMRDKFAKAIEGGSTGAVDKFPASFPALQYWHNNTRNPLQFWSALSQRPNQFASTFISWASAPPKRNPGAAPLNQRWHPSEIRRSEQDLKQAWKLENCFVDVSNVSLPDFTLALAKLHHGGQSRLYFPHWKALASSK